MGSDHPALGRVAACLFAAMWGMACLAAAAPTTPANNVSPDEFRVEGARIGDRVRYDVTWTELEDAYGSSSNRQGRFSLEYKVLGLGTAVDRGGGEHEVVQVAFSADLTSFDDWTWSTVQETRGKVAGVHFVDLSTHEIVQRWSIEARRPESRHANISAVAYGPLEGLFPVAAWGMDLDQRWIYEFQNDTLRTGSFPAPAGDDPYRPAPVPVFDVDGLRNIAPPIVTSTHLLPVEVQADAQGARLQRSIEVQMESVDDAFGTRVQLRSWVNMTMVWAQGSPYPANLKGTVESQGPQGPLASAGQGRPGSYSFEVRRTAAERGIDLIPWTVTAVPPPAGPDARDVWERSARPYPLDGEAARWPYRLEEAMANLESDSTLLEYVVWRNLHPKRLLVGVDGRLGSDGAFLWHVAYADPQAAEPRTGAIVLQSERTSAGVVTNIVRGQAKVLGLLDPDLLPRDAITFAQIEVAWRTLAGSLVPLPKEPPDRFGWGLPILICVPVTCSPSGWGLAAYPRSLQEAWVGVSPGSSPVDPGVTTHSFFMMRVDEPLALDLFSLERIRSLEPDNLATQYGVLPPSGEGAAPEVAKPPAKNGSSPAVPIAASLGVALLVVIGLKAILTHLSLWPLYSKVQRHDLLKSALRERLVQAVQSDPGITRPELHRQLGGGWSTLVYHLRTLERNGLVISFVHGRHRCFFLPDSREWAEREAFAVLRNPRARLILQAINQRPGVTPAELSRAVRCTPRNVRWHLQRLAAARCIAMERRGPNLACFARRHSAAAATTVPWGHAASAPTNAIRPHA